MHILPLIQRIMGVSLTAGFFAHDLYYVNTVVGMTVASLVFILAILCFHTVVFMVEASIAEINSEENKKRMRLMRYVCTALAIGFSLNDYFASYSFDEITYNFQNLITGLLSLTIVIFPESVFKIIFALKKKN